MAGQAVPAPPTNLQAVLAGTTLTLTWSAPAGAAIVAYLIDVGSGPGLSNIITLNTGSTGTIFTAPNVPAGVFFIRIRAQTLAGASGPSNEAQVSVGQPTPGPCTIPLAPSGLSVTVTGNAVAFTWIGGTGAVAHVLEAGSTPAAANLVVLEVGGTTFAASAPNGTYYVRVRARNACGTSAPSNEVIVSVGATGTGGAGLQVLQETVTIASQSNGNAVILGEVRNAGSATAVFVEVNAILRGSAGGLVGGVSRFAEGRSRLLTRSRLVTDTTLAPGETGCFSIPTTVPFGQVAAVEFTTGFDVTEALPTVGRAEIVGNVSLAPTVGPVFNLRGAGQIRNAGGRLIYFVKAVLDFKNAQGRVVDCTTWFISGRQVTLRSGVTTGTGLPAGDVGTFDALSRARVSEVSSIATWTQWDEDPALGDARETAPEILSESDLSAMMAGAENEADYVERQARFIDELRARTRARHRELMRNGQ